MCKKRSEWPIDCTNASEATLKNMAKIFRYRISTKQRVNSVDISCAALHMIYVG